jgi:hypothetical protein
MMSMAFLWASPSRLMPSSTPAAEQRAFTYDAVGNRMVISGSATQSALLSFLWREDFSCGATVEISFESDTGRAIPAMSFPLGPGDRTHIEELAFAPVSDSGREAVVIDTQVRMSDPSCLSAAEESHFYTIIIEDNHVGATADVFEVDLRAPSPPGRPLIVLGETLVGDRRMISGAYGEAATFMLTLDGDDADTLSCPVVGKLSISSVDGLTQPQERVFELSAGRQLHQETVSFFPRARARESLIYGLSVGLDPSCAAGVDVTEVMDLELVMSADIYDEDTHETITICVGYSDDLLNA